MIHKEKEAKALQAIQDLLIEARGLAYENVPSHILAELLDGIEYLPALLIEEKDDTLFFEEFLENLCIRNNFRFIIDKYKSE